MPKYGRASISFVTENHGCILLNPIDVNINKHKSVCSLYLAYLSCLQVSIGCTHRHENEQGDKSLLDVSDSAEFLSL